MRSTTWITVLVGLFMFQSFWNVAAAFCVHEEISSHTQQSFHFGHHQNDLCLDNNAQHDHVNHLKTDSDKKQNTKFQIGEDHQDHLPSMIHWLVQKERTYPTLSLIEVKEVPQFYWYNNYQAPDLSLPSPPPELSPLMVGVA